MRVEPARIVFVIAALEYGGAEVVLLELVKGLDRTRFVPFVLSLAPPGDLSTEFERAGASVTHLHLRRSARYPAALMAARRAVAPISPSVLHGVLFYGDLTARLLRLSGVKGRVVSALHSSYIGPAWRDVALRVTDGCVDSVTAVSKAVAEARIAAGSVRRSKIVVIPNGIDFARVARPTEPELTALRRRYGLDPEDFVVLSVGRLEPEKNFGLLLDVVAQLARKHPRTRALIVGAGGEESRLRRRAGDLGITERVVFAGQVAPVGPLYHLGSVFVLSSLIEGLPMVMLEAMAAGLPMVLPRLGGIPDVVTHDESAFLYATGDAQGLRQALERVLNGPPGERERIVARARSVVQEGYGMRAMVDATEGLYDRLLARGSA